jgi:acetyltransferase-like isoleucine patch superfamily enzyme
MHNHTYLSREELERLGFAALGDDVRIHPSCVLVGCERISIGSHVRIDPFCLITISTRLVIGDYVHISGHATLAGAGPIEIGDHANISHGAKLLSSSDHFSAAGIAGPLVPAAYRRVEIGEIILGRHAIVGAGSVVLPGSVIGEGATIGGLSLVKHALAPWTVNAGVPTRPLRSRDREGIVDLEQAFRDQLGQPDSRPPR